ncbi:MAG: stage II sporulation protein E [Bacillota bacterium]
MVDRTEIFPYRRLKGVFIGESTAGKADKLSWIKSFIAGNQLRMYTVFSVIGFLLGRAVVLDFMSPFGIAFLSVVVLHELNIALTAVSVLLGVVSIGSSELLLKYIFTTVVFTALYVIFGRVRLNKKAVISVIAAVSNLIAGYLIFYVKNYYLYDLFMIIIESVLIGVFVSVYDSAVPVIKNITKRRILSGEEIVALAILSAFCFVGADFSIFGFSIKNICIILLVMLFSYTSSTGTGAALGIILGIIQAISGSIIPAAIGVYGLCGLLCGILKGAGKLGCPIGFILGNALMTFYINGSTEVLIRFYEILTASVIFMVIPNNMIKNMFTFKTVHSFGAAQDKSFNRRVREHTKEKLKEISEVFSELAVTLKDSVESNDYFSQADAANILDQVVNKCCSSCGMCNSCWKRNFYKSYQYLFNLLSAIEGEGDTDIRAMADSMKERCIKSDELVVSLKHHYDLFRNSLSWKKKINESRLVVCDQLREVSSVVSNLALQVNMDVNFNRELEEMLLVALDNAAVRVEDVVVAQTGGIMEVDVKVPACSGKRECVREIIPIVNKSTGKRFTKNNSICNIGHDGMCCIKLKEAQKYQVATGMAKANKCGTVSGDNYSFTELKDGKFMIALSDGMGSGPRADMESYTTIRLLEKFLYAGFDKDVAVRTINSLLLMKSNEESYATIDMTVINQYTGEVEFVKVGAVSTFIKYEDRVDVIKVGSLPVGILNNIEMEFIRKRLKDGEYVVMVTDGILESNKTDINKEQWLADMILGMKTRNPQKLADDILHKCLDLNGGYAEDDMTVLVAKIWE